MALQLLIMGIVEETLMLADPPEPHRGSAFVNTIQILEELVDKVFRKYHLTAVPAPPPTVRFKVVEEFKRMKELFKVA
jgi:hypothetical protein